MSKITPGPWVYRPNEFDDWGVVKAENFTICQARDPRYMTYDITNRHREKGTDPWEANARAIAALPELVEAAETLAKYGDGIREVASSITGRHLSDDARIEVPLSLLEALRSALLKAKGGVA